MQNIKTNTRVVLLAIGCVCMTVAFARASDKPATKVNGELTSVDGMRLLRVWGDAESRGYAHGYLLADDIVSLFNDYINTEQLSGGPQQYETLRGRMLAVMKLPGDIPAELRGMLRGIEAKMKDGARIAPLGRALQYEDLVAMNCIPDAAGVACSSFAVWGDRTKDGDTIAARNLDWYPARFLIDSQLLIAHIPEENSPRNAWLSVTWPGMIICLTGMNEHGTTVAMHDVFQTKPSSPGGFTPRGFCLREAIERAKPDNVIESVASVLREHQPLVGNNVPVSFPYEKGAKTAAAIFEYDGDAKRDGGVTVRLVTDNGSDKDDFIIATNDYRKRRAIGHCSRYQLLDGSFTDGDKTISTKDAFERLQQVSLDRGYFTYQSVIFEPNKRRMRLAISGDGQSAPKRKTKRVKVDEVLQRPNSESTG